MTDFLNLKTANKQIVCPKHGTHSSYISSDIEGRKGHWCMLCWLESLGPSLPVVEQPNDQPLSPAGQAVLDASNLHSCRDSRQILAAALRAAVDLVVPDKCPPIEDFNEFDQGYAVAHITHRQALLAIADELEGIKYGTYRCNISDKNND